jgi:hypothetical protein
VVLYGDEGARTTLRVVEVPIEDLSSSLTADGEVSDRAPAVRYRFEVDEDGSYLIGVDDEDLNVSVVDEDGYDFGCWTGSSCDLTAGTTYYVDVSLWRYDDRSSVPFTLSVERGAGLSIDGSSSVSGSVDGYSSAYHDVVVPDGTTAEISMYSDSYPEPDLDLICGDESSGGNTASESVEITGPFEGTCEVRPFEGAAGDYTLEITEY